MQEMLSPKPKFEKPTAFEVPTEPEMQKTHEEQGAEHAERLESEAASKDLNRVYEEIDDLHEELAIIEGVLRVPESGLPAVEQKGLEESREAMLAQLKKLEAEREQLTEEADPEEAKVLDEAWTRVRAIRQEFTVPTIPKAPREEPVSALKGFWLKVRPENWTKRGRERRDYRKSQVEREVTKMAECESELERLKHEVTDLKNLSFDELLKLDTHYAYRMIHLERERGEDRLSEALNAVRPEDKKTFYAAFAGIRRPVMEELRVRRPQREQEFREAQAREAAANPEAAAAPGKSKSRPSSVLKNMMSRSSLRRR